MCQYSETRGQLVVFGGCTLGASPPRTPGSVRGSSIVKAAFDSKSNKGLLPRRDITGRGANRASGGGGGLRGGGGSE